MLTVKHLATAVGAGEIDTVMLAIADAAMSGVPSAVGRASKVSRCLPGMRAAERVSRLHIRHSGSLARPAVGHCYPARASMTTRLATCARWEWLTTSTAWGRTCPTRP
jgi:hypothetical protein